MPSVDERFLQLLDEHKRILYKIANAYCAQTEDRRDLVQEIVIQLWQSFPRYDSQFAFSTWMYRVGMNVAISFYRGKRRSGRDTLALDEIIDFAAADQTVSDDVRLVHRLIAQLDEMSRALMLLYLEGYSHTEIAAIVGLSVTNVGTRLARIRQKLSEQAKGEPA